MGRQGCSPVAFYSGPGGRQVTKRISWPLLSAASAALVSSATAAHARRCPSPRVTAALFASFTHQLLDRKDARGAYLRFASPKMAQHNPPFGLTRASTIVQWERMTSQANAKFIIKSASLSRNVGSVTFEGVLDPSKPGARVTQRDRFSCGRITEENAEFKILG